MKHNCRTIIGNLGKYVFRLVSVRGLHHRFRRAQTTAILPHPKMDLPVSTAKAMAKRAGWLKETDK